MVKTFSSTTTFDVEAGRQYYIHIGGYNGHQTDLEVGNEGGDFYAVPDGCATDTFVGVLSAVATQIRVVVTGGTGDLTLTLTEEKELRQH